MIEQICSKMSEYVHVYATFLIIWRILVNCLCTKCSGNSFAPHLHFIFTVHPRVTGVVSWSVHLSALVQMRMSKMSVFGQRPHRGRSPVEHWGTFVCSFVRTFAHLFLRSFVSTFVCSFFFCFASFPFLELKSISE